MLEKAKTFLYKRKASCVKGHDRLIIVAMLHYIPMLSLHRLLKRGVNLNFVVI